MSCTKHSAAPTLCRVPAVLLVLVTFLAAASGCTTMRYVEDVAVPAVFERVAKGDRVKIRTTDGRTYELKVTAVDRDGITGRQAESTRTVLYGDIETLEVSEFDWFRTTFTPIAILLSPLAMTNGHR